MSTSKGLRIVGDEPAAAAAPSGPGDPGDRPIDLAAVRARLAGKTGPAYWRSLEELAGAPELEEWLHREFPRQASAWDEGVSRRRFLQLSGASLALAGVTGCTTQPPEEIVPYVRQPEQIVPGQPLYYATATTLAGYAQPVLAESHMGRPTKLEGNPQHPLSQGATDVYTQAEVLNLYDPERSQSITNLGQIRPWGALVTELAARLRAQAALGGEGLRILSGAITSPTLADQILGLRQRFPGFRWHRWEPAADHHERRGAVAAFGRPVEPHYLLSRARVIVAVEGDLFNEGPGCVHNSLELAAGRRVAAGLETMNRLYVVESTPSTAGTVADHRLALPPAEVAGFVHALAAALGVAPAPAREAADPRVAPWVEAVAQDLRANAGASLVTVGEYAPPAVHVLAHAINQALGNVGTTVTYLEPAEADPVDHLASLAELVRDMDAGRVDTLLILGTNPVYTAPVDLGFTAGLQKVPLTVHHGLYEDETSIYCRWHVPATHELESWGDARAHNGLATIIQPLIEPLYQGRAALELIAILAERVDATPLDLVRGFWQTRIPGDAAWQQALHDGFVPGTEQPAAAVSVGGGAVAAAAAEVDRARAAAGELALLFRPDPGVFDGRYANNGWLQELPRPLTKLTWDNALLVAPATAERLGIGHQELVELSFRGRKLTVPAWITPGQADGAATLTLGYGRSRVGSVGTGTGFNAYELRRSDALWTAPGVGLATTGRTYPLAATQNHHMLDQQDRAQLEVVAREVERRDIVRVGTWEQYRQNPGFLQEGAHHPEEVSLYPEYEYDGYAWGMAIDMSVCTGCSACVVACQAENNIPVVGKEQVMRGREMHWLRIDRYFTGDLDAPMVHNQPMLCQHCEKAPCEVVCPVAATAHSEEGLNDMVYNRCVGTRYCSNNCPYKVRRFNFLDYNDNDAPVLDLLRNPDVTVRMRGVMEKCTYCVQRINGARQQAKTEGRKIRAGEVVTACQQACPTRAIVFGDINDESWEVTRLKASPLNYGVLAEIGTQPRTTYLAKIRNPNPLLEPQGDAGRT